MKLGDRARFFDSILWAGKDVGDNDQFFLPATVVGVQNQGTNVELVNLVFDHRPDVISRGHFSDNVREIK